MPSFPKACRAWVAMSGGVDSSTAAALLLKRGFRVEGVFMDLFDCRLATLRQKSSCCSPRDRSDAKRVAEQLGIPLHVVGLQGPFREYVIDPFVHEYKHGRTPNPCILCNQWIKFTHLLHTAKMNGADFLATGHYARKVWDPAAGVSRLEKGIDPRRDQSYFLFPLKQEQLERVIWPLGQMTKEGARRQARAMGLHVAEKTESREICFIPDNDYRGFLELYASSEYLRPGVITDRHNHIIGGHRGVQGFTIGQRKGLGIPWKEPLYVLKIDPGEHKVIAGPGEHLYGARFEAGDVSWIAGEPPGESFRAQVRIRYRHREVPATVHVLGRGRIQVQFDEPQRAITPGQAAVLYQGRTVLGGGWIRDANQG